ncbi:MAG: hypothetical protein V4476_18300 [Pseudomonadota bacterium]
MTRLAVSALALTFLPCCLAGAVTLHLCTMESGNPPFITVDATGVVDQLIRQAAQEVGIAVEYHVAPLTRCREEVRNNVADGFPYTPYSPSLAPVFVYPMRGAGIDAARAVSNGRTTVFRRVGSKTEWDGRRFAHLSTPVLVPFGMAMLQDRLKALEIGMDNSGKTMEANFVKMLAGRSDVAVGTEYHGRELLALPRYAGKIEELPVPFTDAPYFLGTSHRFYQANPQLVEQLWDAIGRIRRTPAFQATQRKALEELAKSQKK